MDSTRPKKVSPHGRDSLVRAGRRLGANHLAFAASVFGFGRRRRPSLVADFRQRESLFDQLSAKYSADETHRLPELSMLYRLLGKTLAGVYLKWLAAIDFSLSQTQLTFPQFISQTLLVSPAHITQTNVLEPHVIPQTLAGLTDRPAPSPRPAAGENRASTRELVRRAPVEKRLGPRETSRMMFAQLERLFDARHTQEQSGATLERTTIERTLVERLSRELNLIERLADVQNFAGRERAERDLAGRLSQEQRLFAPSRLKQQNVRETIDHYLQFLVASSVAPARARRDVRSGSRTSSLIDRGQSHTSRLLQIFTSEQISRLLSPEATAPTLFLQGRGRVETTSYARTRTPREAAQAHDALTAFGSPARQMTVLNVFAQTALEAFLPASSFAQRVYASRDKSAATAAAESVSPRNDAGGHAFAGGSTGAGNFVNAAESASGANESASAVNNLDDAASAQREVLQMPLAVRPAPQRHEDGRAEFQRRETEVLRRRLNRLSPLTTEAFTQKILQTLEVLRQDDASRKPGEPANGTHSELTTESRHAPPARVTESGQSVSALILRKFAAWPSGARFQTVSEGAFVRARASLASAGEAAREVSTRRGTTEAVSSEFGATGANAFDSSAAHLSQERTLVSRRTQEVRVISSPEEQTAATSWPKEGSSSSSPNQEASATARRSERAHAVESETREPLVLLKRIVSRAEREMLARMGRQPDVSAWMETVDARSLRQSGAREGRSTRERQPVHERQPMQERESMTFVTMRTMPLVTVQATPFASAQRFERSRAAAAETAAKASAAVVAGETFMRSLNTFRTQRLLKISVQGSEMETIKLLSEGGAQVSFLLPETFVRGAETLAARGRSARGLRDERSLKSERRLETFADGVERMSKVLLRRTLDAGGASSAGGVGGAEMGRGVEGMLASLRKEETARPPDLRYVFTTPATPRPSVAEQKVTHEVEQKEVVELVQREVRALMSSNKAAASMNLTRADYSKISEQVYSTLVRRLMSEKERLGLHTR